jgi:hypothetical protein
MKRHEHLQPLSRQHHVALVLARTLREWHTAGPGPEDQRRVARAVYRFWAEELRPHFRAEEEELLGRWDRPGTDELATRVVQEHIGIHRVGQRLASALSEDDLTAAWDEARRLADCVHAHVRFEERQWLPALEAELGAQRLAEAQAAVDAFLEPGLAESLLPPRPGRAPEE